LKLVFIQASPEICCTVLVDGFFMNPKFYNHIILLLVAYIL